MKAGTARKVTSASVSNLVFSRPGLSHSAAATALGGGRGAALQAVRSAVAEGLVHEAPTLVTTRGGAARSARGLYPGPAQTPTPRPPAPVSDLRRLREQAAVSLQRVADQLGVSKTLVHRWEMGLQPMPHWALRDLYGALEDAQTPQRPGRRRDSKRLRELLTKVRRSQGISWHALVGRNQRDRQLMEAARREGLVYEAPAWSPVNRQQGVGIFTGRRPKAEPHAAVEVAGQRDGQGA